MDNFEKLRKSRGLKITEACDLVGISRSLYYSIRDRGQRVSEKAMRRLDDAANQDGASILTVPAIKDYAQVSAPASVKVTEPEGSLSKAEVSLMVGEIKLRLDMILAAFGCPKDR